MKAQINFGQESNKDIIIDLVKENIHTILVCGASGSGKSIFHANFYYQLAKQNSPEELGLVFFDMVGEDFTGSPEPSYLFFPPYTDSYKALSAFEVLGDISLARVKGELDSKRAIFIQIEECDMIIDNKAKFERAFLNIANNKDKNNMFLVFSTGRPSPDVFTKTVLDAADMKIVFPLSWEEDYQYILGQDASQKLNSPGQKILNLNNKNILVGPYPEQTLKTLADYYSS